MRGALWIIAGFCGWAIAGGPARAFSPPAMSPAGQGIVGSAYGKPYQTELTTIFRRKAYNRRQIDLQLQSEHPDWELMRTLLDRDFADDLLLRRMSKAVDRRLLDALSESDRIIYLRQQFPPERAPDMTITPKP